MSILPLDKVLNISEVPSSLWLALGVADCGHLPWAEFGGHWTESMA